MEYCSNSERDTEELGRRLGERVAPGTVIAYTGDLGAGKTAFTRGLARGLGVPGQVTSPTFTIVNEYEGGRLPCFTLTCTAWAVPMNFLISVGRLPGPGRRVRRGVERDCQRRAGGRRARVDIRRGAGEGERIITITGGTDA